MIVHLRSRVHDQIRLQAGEHYPYEACGALIGRVDGEPPRWHVEEIIPAQNEHADDRRRRYRIPPEFQVRAELAARARGHDVLGYYHSHPDHPAVPSEYDRSHAWPGYLYVICSVAAGRAREIGAFCLSEDGSTFAPVMIEAAPSRDAAR